MFRNTFFVCLVLSGFLLFSCAGKDAQGENNHASSGSKNDSTVVGNESPGDSVAGGENKGRHPQEELIPVEVTVARTGDISSYILLSSNLETEKMTDVYARIEGLVEQIYVEEGDYVQKNQILMKLEAEEYALAEAKARVDFEQEKNLYERKKAMFDKNLVSKEEFDNAKFSLDAKRIAWDEAKLNLSYTRITAPISGVIGERLKRPGDRIKPTDKLFTVINNQEMIAVVHIPEREIGTIEKGQQAFVTSEHLGDEQFSGWVKRVSPVVDPQSGTFKVTIGVKNHKNRLRPGMFVNTHIITDVHKNTVLIPKTAVIYENENMYVFVVRDGIAHKITLKPGYQDYEKVESLADIQSGEKIIVVGQAGLKDNTRVKIVAEQQSNMESKQTMQTSDS